MPIETLTVENFQKHAEFSIEFDPRLTTVVGDTDAGKSSLLRALRWVCLNLPASTAFIRRESKGAVCSVVVDGRTIVRTRKTDGTNEYELDGKKYVAFGTGVPEPIREFLRLGSLNFVGQKEPDFWLSLSAAEVSRQLNSVVDLGVIDESNENIGKMLWQAQATGRSAKEAVQATIAARTALEWVEEADATLKAAESAKSEHSRVAGRRVFLAQQLSIFRGRQQRSRECAAFYMAAKAVGLAWVAWQKTVWNVSRLRESLREYKAQRNAARFVSMDFSPVAAAVEAHDAATLRRVSLSRSLRDYKSARKAADSCAGLSEAWQAVQAAVSQWRAVLSRSRDLRFRLRTFRQLRDSVWLLRDASDALLQQAHDAVGGVCPVCGKAL